MTRLNIFGGCITILSLATCTQVDKTLGDNLLPPDQTQPLHIDTLHGYLRFSTKPMDTLTTATFSTAALGYYNHPQFGTTKAGFAAQFLPMTSATSYFGDTIAKKITFDSMRLVLTFTSTFYGETYDNAHPLEIEIYELQTPLDTISYLGASKMDETNIINSFNPRKIATGSMPPHDTIVSIRIIDTDLMQRLQDSLMTESSENFLSIFNGLYITAKVKEGENGVIKYISPVITSSTTSATSALWAYGQYPSADTAINILFGYLIYSSSARFAVYQHERTTEPHHPDTALLQGLHGLGIWAQFDANKISAWRGTKTINRVELLMDIAYPAITAERLDMFPSQLSALYKTDGNYSVIRDISVGTFDGYINRSLMRYTINITHFFNDAANGKTNAMWIVPSTFYSAMSYGIVHTTPLLRITYSDTEQ